jgi:hypothetical protein
MIWFSANGHRHLQRYCYFNPFSTQVLGNSITISRKIDELEKISPPLVAYPARENSALERPT